MKKNGRYNKVPLCRWNVRRGGDDDRDEVVSEMCPYDRQIQDRVE